MRNGKLFPLCKHNFWEYFHWWFLTECQQPVHKWMVRHIYFPCLRHKIPKGVAIVIAFFFSAVFHELCIGVPCHMIKFWAFMGIMLQVPLCILTNFLQNKFQNTMVGNMIFWFFFSIFGQPMCVLLYYHDSMNQKLGTDWTANTCPLSNKQKLINWS